MKFILIDQITELEAESHIEGVKNLSLAEEYLSDHFPGFPVMPGVLMLEALTQLSAWLMRVKEEFRYSMIMLKQAKAVKYNNFLVPGKSLKLRSELKNNSNREYEFKGTGTVDGTSAVSAKLILVQFNLAEKNPNLQESDETQLLFYRNLFEQVKPKA